MADFSSLSDCQTRLGLTSDADVQLLRGYMAAATGMILDFLNRDPRLNDYVETCHGHATSVLSPYNYPIVDVQSLVVDGLTIDPSRYTFDEFAIYLKGGTFPRGRANIQLSYSAGEDPVPRQLREAHMVAVTGLWIARDQNQTRPARASPACRRRTGRPKGRATCRWPPA